jgi:hypothetical protein
VRTPPLAGMGCVVDMLRRICAEDKEALDLLDRATQGRQGEHSGLVDNIHEVGCPTGTSSGAALRRVRKDRPDLHLPS